MASIEKKYDFVLLFDVTDGNPNGDPDAGNLPRIDPETGHGLVTDVCLKRKLRNFVEMNYGHKPGYEIFIKEKAVLNTLIDKAHEDPVVAAKEKGAKTEAAREFMCRKFFDVRTFGAVMSTGKNAGQVRGPVQLTFARSIDPILPLEHSITRMAVATEAEAEKQDGDNRTMGRKATVPYALYRTQGFISANFARQTGFSEADLEILWQGIERMFEEDRSASRGQLNARKLIVFEHQNALGSAPAWKLFDRIQVTRRDDARPARAFSDYVVTLQPGELPEGVRMHERL